MYVSVLRREDDRGHDGRDGDDDEPQPGREEEGDEGAEGGRPGPHSSTSNMIIITINNHHSLLEGQEAWTPKFLVCVRYW